MDGKATLVEHVYRELKALVCSGAIPPAGRIDVAEVCERFRASRSPVRHALNRLVGEGLLELHAHDGFYLPRVTPQTVKDLYDWNEDVLKCALSEIAGAIAPLPALSLDSEDIVAATEAVFVAIATAGGNAEHVRAIQSNNDRLRAIRSRKARDLFNRPDELQALVDAWADADIPRLDALVTEYHARRLASLSDIVVAAYSGHYGTR